MIAEMIKEDQERLDYLEEFDDEITFTLRHLANLNKLKWIDSLIYLDLKKRYEYLLKTPATLLKLACDTLCYSIEYGDYISALLEKLPRLYYFNEDNLELALEILDEASSVFSIYVEDGKIKFFD